MVTSDLLLAYHIDPGAIKRIYAQYGKDFEQMEAFFGADRKLARLDKLVEYYNLLGEQSPRLEVVNMGPTTMGHRSEEHNV